MVLFRDTEDHATDWVEAADKTGTRLEAGHLIDERGWVPQNRLGSPRDIAQLSVPRVLHPPLEEMLMVSRNAQLTRPGTPLSGTNGTKYTRNILY